MHTTRMLMALVTATMLLAVNARAADVTIAGGDLDTSITDATVYMTMPNADKPPLASACQPVLRYTAFVQAGQFADIATLFAPDAVVLEPTRQIAVGRAQIAAFYQDTIGKMKPGIVPVSYVGNATDCMVVFASRATVNGAQRYKLSSVDHFTLDDTGKFARMVAFVRP